MKNIVCLYFFISIHYIYNLISFFRKEYNLHFPIKNIKIILTHFFIWDFSITYWTLLFFFINEMSLHENFHRLKPFFLYININFKLINISIYLLFIIY